MNRQAMSKMLLYFWCVWWITQLWIDSIGALAHLGLLHASWAPDLNYPFMVKTLSLYPLGKVISPFLYAGIIAWTAIVVIVFIWACVGCLRKDYDWTTRLNWAYGISIALWLAFLLADQLILKFDLEQNHMVQVGFQLLCYVQSTRE